MGKFHKIMGGYPLFLVLLPFFFVLHGYVEYYNFIPLSTILFTGVKYILISFLLAFLLFPIFKNFLKASIIAFVLMLFHLFFGVYYDFLNQIIGKSFLSSYTFIISSFLTFCLLFTILLIKRKKFTSPIARYLNVLFLVLLLLDLGNLVLKISNRQPPAVVDLTTTTKKFTSVEKPDIYLILLDEYAGATQLKNVFSFDNSNFLNELKKRGFSVQENSKSNYNKTIYSIASLLNMDYINNLSSKETQQHLFLCRTLTKNNSLSKILTKNGYNICNYSYFNIGDKEKEFPYSLFFPSEQIIYTQQTFLYRLYKNQGYRFPWLKKFFQKESLNDIKINNSKLDSLTREIALHKNNSPRFIYSHFLMPHEPFFYDSTGKEINYDSIPLEGQANAYIQYLIYTNNKVLSIIDYILASSTKAPVIVLMSDHGLKGLGNNPRLDHNFNTLNAVFFPDGNYEYFYDGMTNVNQFRVILNSLFQQHLPMLKDSTSFIK